jgi:iron complex outermembrane receptor protein
MGPYCDAARPSDQARNVCGPHLFIPIALLLLTTGASLTADADGIGPDNSSDTTGLAEIVVTARLRSENLMSVPDTVKAFSPEEITERQLTQLSDFLTLTPNAKIIVEQDVAQSEIYIRGVGSNKSQLPAVAFVIDGVILPDNDAFTMDLSDANQVEILKGPQGALYGKGALAGVINITTRQPSNTPSGDLKIDFGSNNTYGVFADLDGPIIPDTLLGGVQVRYHSTDGPFENHYNGSGFEFDRDEKISGKLIATPTDILRLELDLSYYQQYAGLPPYVGVNVLGMNSTNITSAEAATPVDQDCSMSCTTHRVVDMGAFTVAWDTPAGKLSSITAYDQIDLHFYQDVDFTSLNLVDSFGERDTRSFSQEFRLASTAPGARLRYNFSTYFQHEDYYFDSQGWFDFCFFGVISCATPPHVPSGILVPLHLNQFETKTDAYAIAGQLSYDITPQMEATVALRYDDDRPHEQDFLNDVSPSTSYSEWQPKFSLAYKPTSDLTGYATYSRGFKPGVFNPPQPAGSPFPTVIKKEVTDNLEVGVKTSSFERRLIITAAAFYTDYTDPQEFHVDIQSGGNEAVNVDKAHIVGFETDMAARPVANIDLNAAFGYTKSNIVSFNGTSEYVGQSLPYQPRYTANLGAQYTAHLGSTDMKMRADWKWDGKTSFQDFQDPNPNQFLTQAHDDTLDLSVTFLRGAWAFNLYGKNVLNERYVVSAYSRYISCLLFCAGALNQDVLLPAPGVTWGGQLRYAF